MLIGHWQGKRHSQRQGQLMSAVVRGLGHGLLREGGKKLFTSSKGSLYYVLAGIPDIGASQIV